MIIRLTLVHFVLCPLEIGIGRSNDLEAAEPGAYLSWRNLNYSVFVRDKLRKKELQLLHDVSGYVKPGMMLALMVPYSMTLDVQHYIRPYLTIADLQGSSGAGKSTLLDVLARRKTGGKITGEILINGRKADSQLNRIIGYVEQQDIHNPTQTVLEALEFSATVRSCTSQPRRVDLL